MEVKVLYQDEWFIAVSKPAHLLVHPYKECTDKVTLLRILRNQCGKYLYPIHRLDRPVTGIVVFGLCPEATKLLQQKWHSDEVEKLYLALSKDEFNEPGEFSFELKNDNKIPQPARTEYWPLKVYPNATFHKIKIHTGRRHQIRRHFSRRVQHLLGDRKYGKKKYNDYYLENFGLERIFLHATSFNFVHPMTGEKIRISDPLPNDLDSVLTKMEPNLKSSYQYE